MRVCIVGNSHSAALIHALNDGWSRPGLEFDYYVIPGRVAPMLHWHGGYFTPYPKGRPSSAVNPHPTLRSSVGQELHILQFDAIVISALTFGAPSNDNLVSGDHILGRLGLFGWPELERASDLVEQVSRSAFEDVVRNLQARTGPIRFLNDLPSLYCRSIVVQMPPPPARRLLSDPDWMLRDFYGDALSAVHGEFYDLTGRLGEAMVAAAANSAAFLHAPREAIAEGFLRDEFCKSNDPWHANVAYGRLVLEQLVDSLVVDT